MRDGCVFCKIIAGETPAAVVYKDDLVTAIRDIHPQAPTHILVLPNRHLAGVAEAQPGDVELLGRLLLAATEVARQENLGGYRLVINNGSEAGQSVFHLHLHVLGGRRLRWPPG